MRQGLILFLVLVVTAAALLTTLPAPPWVWTWKLAILMTEFGHWLVILPLGLLIAAMTCTTGPARFVAVVFCLLAAACLLRPTFVARRMALALPEELSSAVNGAKCSDPAFEISRLYRLSRSLRAEVATETFSRVGSEELKLDFYRPLRRLDEHFPDRGPARRTPCVVVIHGGGWDAGDRTQLPELNHRLANLGYAVASIEYRLAPRWRWPAQKEDTLAAIAWLKENADRLGFEATNLVLLGRSAGGQIAEVVAYSAHDPAIRGVISFYAPSDMVFGYRNSDENDAIRSPSLMRALLGGTPDEQRKVYEDASALGFVGPGSPPTLLIHGYLDTLVWHRHDIRLAARLAEFHVPHYFLSLPWATHGFDFNSDGPGGQLADYAIKDFLGAVTAQR